MKSKKPTYIASAVKASRVTMFPELAHYEVPGKSITLHEGDRFYAIVRVEDVNMEGEPFVSSNVFVSDTREGINLCFEGFVSRYPKSVDAELITGVLDMLDVPENEDGDDEEEFIFP